MKRWRIQGITPSSTSTTPTATLVARLKSGIKYGNVWPRQPRAVISPRKVVPLMIPAAALATRAKGQRIAVLDDRHRVNYRDVQLGRDYGAEIQVLSGLEEGEQVVVHPGDDLPGGGSRRRPGNTSDKMIQATQAEPNYS